LAVNIDPGLDLAYLRSITTQFSSTVNESNNNEQSAVVATPVELFGNSISVGGSGDTMSYGFTNSG
jgi:hypothetical protein